MSGAQHALPARKSPMPTYQYRCTDCGHDLEAVQKFSDASLTVCPSCGGTLRKVFNAVGVVFKGSGFYRTDSRAGNGSEAGGKSADGKSGSEKGTDTGNGSSGSEPTKSGAKEPATAGSGAKSDSGSSASNGNGAKAPSTGASSTGSKPAKT